VQGTAEQAAPSYVPVVEVGAQQVTVPAVLERMSDLVDTGVVTDTSLTIDRELSYEQTEALARLLGEYDLYGRKAREQASWWVGDFLLYAEKVHGDLFAQIAEATQLAPQTLLNRMSVCRAIPPSERLEGMNFSTHAEVAYMDATERAELLMQAARDGLSREQVRKLKRGEDVLPPAVVETCPTCGQAVKQ
jgi:hypothetical protein